MLVKEELSMTKTLSKKRIMSAVSLSMCALSIVAGCTVETADSTEVASTEQELSCSNQAGTNAVLAALAVSMGKELRRWQPLQDLEYRNGRFYVSATGRAQCADGQCWNTAAILDLQEWSASWQVEFPGGDLLDSGSLRARLYSYMDRQRICESRPDNHQGDNCPAEAHKLTLIYSSPGLCDHDFWFQAKSPWGGNLAFPYQLKNKLLFAGLGENPYLNFQYSGDRVAVDPTLGFNEDGSTSSGACTAACTKMSSSNLTGKCCSCNGDMGTYQRSPWSSKTYLCR